MTHKPSKVVTAKSFSMYVIVTTCLHKFFLFHVITARHYILYKSVDTMRSEVSEVRILFFNSTISYNVNTKMKSFKMKYIILVKFSVVL